MYLDCLSKRFLNIKKKQIPKKQPQLNR